MLIAAIPDNLVSIKSALVEQKCESSVLQVTGFVTRIRNIMYSIRRAPFNWLSVPGGCTLTITAQPRRNCALVDSKLCRAKETFKMAICRANATVGNIQFNVMP